MLRPNIDKIDTGEKQEAKLPQKPNADTWRDRQTDRQAKGTLSPKPTLSNTDFSKAGVPSLRNS